MTRIKVKGTGVRPRSNPDEEPDFWNNYPWVGSNDDSESMHEQTPPWAVPRPSSRGSSSVGSKDSANPDPNLDDMVEDFEPIPISVLSQWPRPQQKLEQYGYRRAITVPPYTLQPLSKDAEDFVLTGWGNPFQYIRYTFDGIESSTNGKAVFPEWQPSAPVGGSAADSGMNQQQTRDEYCSFGGDISLEEALEILDGVL